VEAATIAADGCALDAVVDEDAGGLSFDYC